MVTVARGVVGDDAVTYTPSHVSHEAGEARVNREVAAPSGASGLEVTSVKPRGCVSMFIDQRRRVRACCSKSPRNS